MTNYFYEAEILMSAVNSPVTRGSINQKRILAEKYRAMYFTGLQNLYDVEDGSLRRMKINFSRSG
jgi:hypothetical protein